MGAALAADVVAARRISARPGMTVDGEPLVVMDEIAALRALAGAAHNSGWIGSLATQSGTALRLRRSGYRRTPERRSSLRPHLLRSHGHRTECPRRPRRGPAHRSIRPRRRPSSLYATRNGDDFLALAYLFEVVVL
jgi:hypothetical protein